MSDPITRLNAALEGRYAIKRELGEGGMATVYLADDLKHERKVALKVLKPELAAVVGAERFLAEIRTTANLQHPHILALFDSGEVDGLLYYVMPFVQGESLRERLDREHQLPVEEAVRIAVAVAGALDYAHRQGVIHRDVKPANLLIHDGQPVVSDFGIALAVSAGGGGRLTETGLSMGTPHYMSPEQATGDQHVGAATDIYALGCVLYEMLVGEPPYTGSTPQAILGKIIAGEPASVRNQRASVPANVEAAIRKALEKLPADRFRTAGELADVLQGRRELKSAARKPASRMTPEHRLARVLPWAVAAVASVAAVWAVSRGFPSERVRYLNISLPNAAPLAFVGEAYFGVGQPAFAVSSDGSAVAYVAQVEESTQLYLRRGEGHDAVPLSGTEGAYAPFFSPEGDWIGFFVGDQLLRISITGDQVLPIAEANDPYGGSWGEDGRIAVVTLDGTVLSLVPAGGGRLEPVFNGSGQNVAFPQWLPGGEWLLVACLIPQPHACVVSSSTGEVRRLVEGGEAVSPSEANSYILGSNPRYVRSGHVVFSAIGSNVLMGAPFDPQRLEVTGEPVPLISGIRREGYIGALQLSVSENGDLVYAAGSDAMAGRFVWAGADHALDTLPLDPQVYGAFALSPDGRSLAATP